MYYFRFDNPAASADLPAKQLTYNYIFSLNAWLLCFPSSLLCDWTMGTVPLIKTFMQVENLSTLLFYSVLCALIYPALFSHDKVQRSIIIMVSWGTRFHKEWSLFRKMFAHLNRVFVVTILHIFVFYFF